MKELTLLSPVSALPGIGKTRAEAFGRLGVFSVRDLLYHFPRAYENRGDIRPIREATDGMTHALSLVVATEPRTARLRRGMSITKFRAFDESGTIEIVFFNQPYCTAIFGVGDEFRFYGKLTEGKKYYTLTNPAYEPIKPDEPLPDLVPRYPLGEGITGKIVANAVTAALPCLATVADILPENIRQKHEFPTLSTAIRTLHSPTTSSDLRQAIDRLAFDEYLTFSLGLSLTKRSRRHGDAIACRKQNITPLLALLPYTLTDGQKSAVREIASDMAAPEGAPMSRILVGDVGCGKTICAAM